MSLRLRARLASLAIAILILAIGVPAYAEDGDLGQANVGDDETAQLWFVELSTPPTSDGTSPAAVAASKDSFRNVARAKGVTYTERYAYGDLWNGFSVRASTADITTISRLSGVTAIWPVATMTIADPVTGGETIDLATAIGMTGADYVQDTLGITGKNVKVAVIDSGIDYQNPDLGGCFGPSCRVFTGWDFVGDSYNADSSSLDYQPTPHPDPDPDDCAGHGTHVSGIVGAKGTVKGVAPDVRFGAYRVFGCNGSTEADIMLLAMERALHDHMDVINMSIGSSFQWPQYPTAVAADRLVTKHGIVVVASIGNSGTSGLYSAGSPGLGEKVIGVASFDNTTISSLTFNVSTSGRQVAYQSLATTPEPPTSGTSAEIVHVGRGCQADPNANPPIASTDPYLADPAGKVALIERGLCTFNNKYQRAAAAGAVGAIIYAAASAPGLFIGGSVVGVDNVFGISIARDDGLHLIAQTAPHAIWTDVRVRAPNPTAGLISSFSSYGLSPDLNLKPDIGAPGGLIYSTLPLEQGGHGNLSGTSMSSPHVAGAVALLLQARSNDLQQLGAERVRGILQNTATPLNRTSNSTNGLDNVHRQGAGMLNIRAAIEATAEITPSKLALGESQSGPATRTLTVRARPGSEKSVTYTLSHAPAASTGSNTFVPTFDNANPATVTFGAPTVTVKTNQTASVGVTITANSALADRSLYGGYIVFTGDDGSLLRVPYAGFKGDYQSIQVLTNSSSLGGVPGLAARQRGYVNQGGAITPSYTAPPANYVFTMGPKPNLPANCSGCGYGPTTFLDVPYYLVHFNHHPRSATFTAYDSTGTTALGQAFSFDYLRRNSSASGFFAFGWDGTVGSAEPLTTLPNGTYVMKVTVLKALGEPGNPAHMETFTFGPVTIARP